MLFTIYVATALIQSVVTSEPLPPQENVKKYNFCEHHFLLKLNFH